MITRVGVFSDSHGDTESLKCLLAQMGKLDAACFLGDISSDADYLREILPGVPGEPILYAVKGNNDFATSLPAELIFEIGGKRLLLTHGHLFGGWDPSKYAMALRAEEYHADIVLYGHTHRSDLDFSGKVMLFNPGSAGNYCRGGRAVASVLEIREDGSVNIQNYHV